MVDNNPTSDAESRLDQIGNTYEDELIDVLEDRLVELDDLINGGNDADLTARATALRQGVQDRIEYLAESDDPDDK